MKRFFIIIALLAMVIGLNAQIGYQVSLLNTATGEPRANENVEVTIEITDSEGTSICKETKNATTNDFGVLSLQVGNSTTFENADWSKLPFYVSATVDDILVGKSQILNVPVAEAAKTLVGNVSKSDIVGEWMASDHSCIFNEDGTFLITNCQSDSEGGNIYFTSEGIFQILGFSILLIDKIKNNFVWGVYNMHTNKLLLQTYELYNDKYGGIYGYQHVFTKQN